MLLLNTGKSLLYCKTSQDRAKTKQQSSVSFPECLVEVSDKVAILESEFMSLENEEVLPKASGPPGETIKL